MLSRHFLRSKVLQSLYAAKTDPVELNVVEKNYKHMISRLNDLGTIQLAALVHFAEFSGAIMDEGQRKYLPTDEERNPVRRIPENLFICRLADNFDLRPQGFRMFEVRDDFSYSYEFVAACGEGPL